MRYQLSKYAVTAVLAALVVACGGGGGGGDGGTDPVTPPVVPGSTVAKFLPADGKTLLFVGQDIDADNGYVKGVNQTPAGVTIYTSLKLDSVFARNHGQPEGAQDWNSVKVGYPNSAVAVGLYFAGPKGNTLLDQYVAGDATFDANVDTLIDELQSFNRPVFLRIGYEADANFNNHDPAKYKAGWKKIVDRIRAKKADRIATVWQVLGVCGTSATLNNLPTEAWYPGDDLVDWTGFSWFRGDPTCTVNALRTNHPTKPIMIAESAPTAYDLKDGTYNPNQDFIAAAPLTAVTGAQIWDGWYKKYFDLIEANKDAIRAVAYINQDWKSYATWKCSTTVEADGSRKCPSTYWGDTRVEVNPTVKTNWLSAIGGAQFLSTASTTLFSKLNGFTAGTVTPVKGAYRQGGKPTSVPGVIEAESYDRGGEGLGYHDMTPLVNTGYVSNNVVWRANEGVDIMTFGPSNVTDGSDKFAVADTQAGEWTDYTVNATVAGQFPVNVLVSSAGVGGTFDVLLDGTSINGIQTVPDTTTNTNFVSVNVGTVTLAVGAHTLRLKIVSTGSGTSAGNFDKIDIVVPRGVFPAGNAAPVIAGTTVGATTTIEIENFDLGGPGVAFYNPAAGAGTNFTPNIRPGVDLTNANAGSVGLILGYTTNGQWLEYTVNVAQAGTYGVTFNTALGGGRGAGSIAVSASDGKGNVTPLGSSTYANCAGSTAPCDYNTYKPTASAAVTLTAGVQIIRVTFAGAAGGAPGNVDSMTFTKQ
jgi:Carbohydrate binding module (family 6)/DUF5010 C-terminal domain